MKTYWCYIKSHGDYPDYDYEFEAQNDAEAIKMMTSDLHEFSIETIKENMAEVLPNGKYRRIL